MKKCTNKLLQCKTYNKRTLQQINDTKKKKCIRHHEYIQCLYQAEPQESSSDEELHQLAYLCRLIEILLCWHQQSTNRGDAVELKE